MVIVPCDMKNKTYKTMCLYLKVQDVIVMILDVKSHQTYLGDHLYNGEI